MEHKYEMDMSTGHLMKKMIIFSIPLMLTGILQLLYNSADMIVLGQFAGHEALAAVGSNSSLINLVFNVFMGISVGSSVALGRKFGLKDEIGSKKIVNTSMWMSVVFGLIVSIFGVLMAKRMLILMDCPDDVLPLSSAYLIIFFIGAPFNMVYNFGASLLRAVGDTRRPLYILILAGLVNVVLNLFFVVPLQLSVVGVALATILSQLLSAVLIVICLVKTNGYCNLVLKDISFDKKAFLEITKIGVPAALQSTIFSISNVVIQSSINSFGSLAMSGDAAAGSIGNFVYTSMNTIYHASLSFTSQNYGAKKYKNIKKVFLNALLLVSLIGLFLGSLVIIFSDSLISIYNSDPGVVEYGVLRLCVLGLAYFACGLMDTMVGVLRGIGYSVMPMIVSLIGACGLRLVYIFTIFKSFRSLTVLYLSFPISWLLTSMVHILCFIICYRLLIKRGQKEVKELAVAE